MPLPVWSTFTPLGRLDPEADVMAGSRLLVVVTGNVKAVPEGTVSLFHAGKGRGGLDFERKLGAAGVAESISHPPVTDVVPPAVGVPEIVPVSASRLRPVGNVPSKIDQ